MFEDIDFSFMLDGLKNIDKILDLYKPIKINRIIRSKGKKRKYKSIILYPMTSLILPPPSILNIGLKQILRRKECKK